MRLLTHCELHYFGKGLWVPRGKFGKELPIDFHMLFSQCSEKLGICSSMNSRARVDSGDPELAERSLLQSPITVCVLLTFVEMMLSHREELTTSTPVAFCARENALATAVGGNLVL